ncbi:short-chain dehydrogenase [Streptomyces clavuligerus]|nr:short-chain dehydrogenase [Streptomyces clavuligerus]
MNAAADTPTAGEIRRPLSPMERWYWICDQISPLNVVARVRVQGTVPEGALARAGERLVAEHPLLRVAVTAGPDGGDPRFVGARDPRLPVRTVRCGESAPRRWEEEVDAIELATPVDWRTGPLARLTDIAQGTPGSPDACHDLVLTVSHVIADGTTALELLRRVVDLAAAEAGPRAPGPAEPSAVPPGTAAPAQGAEGSAPAVSAAAPPGTAAPVGGTPDAGEGAGPGPGRPRPVLPAPEEMLPRRVAGLPRVLHCAAWTVADQFAAVRARPRRLRPSTPVPPELRRTRLIRRELSGEQLDLLVRRCREEGVTVHSALAAAMALAVADAEAEADGSRRRAASVTVGSPVDFRGALTPRVEKEDAGAYVATVPSHVPVGPGADLWSAARGALRSLRRSRRFQHALALVSLLRAICPRSVADSARTIAMIDGSGPGNVCLSNIGRYDFPARAGSSRLSGAQFIAGISVSGCLVAAVNTTNGTLHWNVTHIDGALPRDRAERITDQAVHLLLQGIRPGGQPETAPGRAFAPGTTRTKG